MDCHEGSRAFLLSARPDHVCLTGHFRFCLRHWRIFDEINALSTKFNFYGRLTGKNKYECNEKWVEFLRTNTIFCPSLDDFSYSIKSCPIV